MARGSGKTRRINLINRYIVQATAIKKHQSVIKAQDEFTREINRQYRAGKLSEEIQFKPIVTKQRVSRKTHKINRRIIALTAIKNDESVDLAQKEYTRKIQREYRARKLRESRRH
ncbi:MAG: hypothetical protein WC626_07045 [Methanoregula sp.]